MWRTIIAAASTVTLLHLRIPAVAASELEALYSVPSVSLLSQAPAFAQFYDDRPADCPPCFNCNLSPFTCLQYSNCTLASGKCSCPPGYGGEDCGQPTCGSLAQDPSSRVPRGQNKSCECSEGWEGINCNVCKTDDACAPLMPDGHGDEAVCYKDGLVVKENYQICDITNRKILDTLKEKKPQGTFNCNAERAECNFQFWVDEIESFYCALDTCAWKAEATEERNTTSYRCDNIKCKCIPDRMLCGADGSIDIGDFLDQDIKGPASFTSVRTRGGGANDGSKFSEPAMNGLISSVFGDESITLDCHAGECLHKTKVPGYSRPIKKINTPLIAGVIAGCALFVVAVILLVFFLSRRNHPLRYGAISLPSDEEEEADAQMLADHKPAALYFEDTSYTLKGQHILQGVSGSVHPGELLAIMGASGAGKTSLLDILARKSKRGAISGSAYLNGEKVADEVYRGVIGFVDQEDTMLATLTVHETILDSALLRLPRDMSRKAKEQKVEDVERQLGIYSIRHSLIGSETTRGISGGEKRRVGIACELVTSPSILFLDEPTSGLDAYNAFNVIECLVTLVKTYNRTVVFTIHQPRSNIVALFDRLILLAKGRTVYSGPFDKCQDYFDGIGYTCPPGFNIADYLVDLTMHAVAPHSFVPTGDEDAEPAGGVSSLVESARNGTATNGGLTRTSSTIAIKSIRSVGGVSMGQNSVGSTGTGANEGFLSNAIRPKGKRKGSIRQQQERQLFTRKPTLDNVPSLRSEGDSVMENGDPTSWVKMARQQGRPRSQIVDHGATDEEAAETGTNLDALVQAYEESEVCAGLHSDLHAAISTSSYDDRPNGTASPISSRSAARTYKKAALPTQFVILSRRTWRNIYRAPSLLLTHYAIAILLAVFIGFLFYGLTDDLPGFQNRLGLFFFLLALFGFSTLTSLNTFSLERTLFVRERAKGYYNPLAYYLAKLTFDIVPLRLLPPLITGCIIYPMTGLVAAWPEFGKFVTFIVLFNLAAAAICLCIGIVVRDPGVASLGGVLLMLFSLLFGGFLLNRATIPQGLRWLQKLSIFHFAFEGLLVNEVRYLSLVDKKYGLNIEVPGSVILTTFGFDVLGLPGDALGLGIVAGVGVVVGYLALWGLLVERR